MINDFIIGKHFIAAVFTPSTEDDLNITFEKVQVLDKLFNEKTIEPTNEESPVITYADTTFLVAICSTGQVESITPFCLEVYVEGWSNVRVKKAIQERLKQLEEDTKAEPTDSSLTNIADINVRLEKIMSLGYSEEEAMKLIDQQNEELKKKK